MHFHNLKIHTKKVINGNDETFHALTELHITTFHLGKLWFISHHGYCKRYGIIRLPWLWVRTSKCVRRDEEKPEDQWWFNGLASELGCDLNCSASFCHRWWMTLAKATHPSYPAPPAPSVALVEVSTTTWCPWVSQPGWHVCRHEHSQLREHTFITYSSSSSSLQRQDSGLSTATQHLWDPAGKATRACQEPLAQVRLSSFLLLCFHCFPL